MKASHGRPAPSVIFIPGTHQVEIEMAVSAITPATEAQGYSGARKDSFPVKRRRKAKCVTRIIIQTNSPPKNDAPSIWMYAVFGEKNCNSSASAMPMLEAMSAPTGDPARESCPKKAGAYPPRDSEKSIREQRYKFVFMLESAADEPPSILADFARIRIPPDEAAAIAALFVESMLVAWHHRRVGLSARMYRARRLPGIADFAEALAQFTGAVAARIVPAFELCNRAP